MSLRVLILLLCASVFSIAASAQTTLRGTVADGKTAETLPSVSVLIKGTSEAAVTDADGAFEIQTATALPVVLVVRYAGYVEQEVTVRDIAEPVRVRLLEEVKSSNLREVNVRGSRISEKQKESPLTVESLDIIGIRETPAANFYEGLSQLKGVDMFSASLAFKVLNTRGFSSTSPVRSLQLIDGVDNQSPGLNFSLGNFLGASELDLQRVELVVGAASAYYGPNAFNGVISMTTRSPFAKPGLEVSLKGAERNLFEGAMRWAQVFKNKAGQEKLGYKLNVFYLRARDWEADNRDATPVSRSQPANLGGYDAVNVYGDEFIGGSDYTAYGKDFPGLGVFYRSGYAERELVDYGINNLKASGAVHYRITPKVEAIVASSFAAGSTIYRGDNPIFLKNVRFSQNRVELRQEGKWFIRAYTTNENAGDSYDIYTTGIRLQNAAKLDRFFKQDFENFWIQNYGLAKVRQLPGFPALPPAGSSPETFQQWQASINPFLEANYPDSLVVWHAAARAFADGVGFPGSDQRARFEPGTPQFDSAFQSITSRSLADSGSRFIDRSALYHMQAEYRFSPGFADFVVGGNARLYRPNSQGTIFSDTAGRRIRNAEGGLYAGVERRLVDDKLKLNVSARLDKNQNFPLLFSPAASAVFEPARDQYARVSFSSAIRNPTLTDQYLNLFVGRALLAGNIGGYEGLVTVPSLVNSIDSFSNFAPLRFFDVAPVRPEKVRTLEAGYRATVARRVYVDVSAYHSWYRDFIGYRIGADIDTFVLVDPITFAPDEELAVRNILRVASNATDQVTTMGATIGLNYYIGQHFAAVANYSWNKLDRQNSTDPLIPAFNTPEHKVNVGFNGRNFHQFSFSANYKWVQGYRFEGSPQFTGDIPSFGLVDVQVSRAFAKVNTTLKVGASNVLNNLHYEIYGGPLIGRLVYASVLYSLATGQE